MCIQQSDAVGHGQQEANEQSQKVHFRLLSCLHTSALLAELGAVAQSWEHHLWAC